MDVKINKIIEDKEVENSRLYSMYEKVLDNIDKNGGITIDNNSIKKEFPDIDFPDEQEVNIIFKKRDKQMLEDLELPESTLGAFIITDPDNILGSNINGTEGGHKDHPDSFNIIIFVDDKEMDFYVEHNVFLDHKVGMDIGLSRDMHLESFCNTLTHELEHAIEFMENSGGLPISEVSKLNEAGKFDYDVFSCMTGYGSNACADDYKKIDEEMIKNDLQLIQVEDDILDITEDRVENNSMKKISKMNIDFLSIYNEPSQKPKKKHGKKVKMEMNL